MNAIAPDVAVRDAYQASLALEDGSSVYITAPTIDLLAKLVARTKGQLPVAEVKLAGNAPAPTAAASPASAPAPSAPSAAPAASALSEAPREVTQDMVNKAVIALVKSGADGTAKAKKILAELGVARATELKAEQLATAYAKFTAEG